MKGRVYASVGVLALLGLVAWFVSRPPRPDSPEQIAKGLSAAAKDGLQSTSACVAFFSEWEALLQPKTAMDEKRLGRIADQIGRYPGIPGATYSAWKTLVELPRDQDIDVSFAFGLPDCQYQRFTRIASRLTLDLRNYRGRVHGADKPVRAILAVLREVLERPVSRQILQSSVSLAIDLRRGGWVKWEGEDVHEWTRLDEYLKKFNRRADELEGDLTRKLAQAKSYKEAPVPTRKALASQIHYSYAQTEASRLRVRALVAHIRPVSG